jgi:DNA-binding XRE family transcriptional regulator
LSIEALAAEADVHWTSLSQIENGKRNPGWNAVVSLATALDVEIGDLARLATEQPSSAP